MRVAIWFIAAICSYLIAGFNLAILLSKAIYHQDIREVGSKNPGVTNFNRVYGNKYAWFIFAFDLLKAALPALIFAIAFDKIFGWWQLGAAYAGVFALIGHVYPVFYRFKGGKGFLVTFALLWVLDWRAGLVATAVMLTVLPLSGFMSLSSILTLIGGGVTLCFTHTPLSALFLTFGAILLVICRHRGNIARLVAGTEKKFSFRKKKAAPEVAPAGSAETEEKTAVGEEKE